VVLDVQARPTGAVFVVPDPAAGLSIEGCRDLAPTPEGWSYLAAQVRALWGVSMVRVATDGRTLGEVPLLTVFPEAPFGRSLLANGYALTWVDSSGEVPALRLQRFLTDGTAAGMPVTVGSTGAIHVRGAIRVLETSTGLVVLHEENGSTSTTRGIAVQPLDRAGVPAGPMAVHLGGQFYNRGLAATVSHGDLLVAGVVGSGVLRLAVQALDARGEALDEPFTATTTEAGTMVLLPTSQGALLVWDQETSLAGWSIGAVPLGCR
jgi:hypothetical protein